MKSKFVVIVFILSGFAANAQKNITWRDLAQVDFEEKYFPAYGEFFLYPHFLPTVQQLDGKLVTIKGYFLNIDPEGKIYILSKGPMSACFFCGVGGPETAIELVFEEKPKFKTDDIIAVTGMLKLNSEDVNHMNYIITDSKGMLID